MCQLSINNPVEAIYFAGKRRIRFDFDLDFFRLSAYGWNLEVLWEGWRLTLSTLYVPQCFQAFFLL